MPQPKRLWIAALLVILSTITIATIRAVAVPICEPKLFTATLGYFGSAPPEKQLVRMIRRAEWDYRLFPIAGHRGKLRANQTLLAGDDDIHLVFNLPAEHDIVCYRGTRHNGRLIGKWYEKAIKVIARRSNQAMQPTAGRPYALLSTFHEYHS